MIPKISFSRAQLFQSWPFLIGLLSGLYFFPLTVLGLDFAYFPGDLGDARFNMYLLEHAHRFLFVGDVEYYWSAPFMFPASQVITFSDNLLGTFPIYSFFRLMGFEVITAFQLWFVSLCLLTYSATYLFLKWLLKNRYAAVLGAMVFAYSMAMQSQINHAQTFPRFAIPLALWAACLFAKDFKVRDFFLTVFAVVYEIYCGVYLGFMLFIPVAILVATAFALRFRTLLQKLKEVKWLIGMAVSTVVNVLILLPIMIPYMKRGAQTGLNSFDSIAHTIPIFKSYFFSQKGSLYWDFLSELGIQELPTWWDHQIFPGLLTMLGIWFAIILVIRRLAIKKQPISTQWWILISSAVLTFVLFLKVGDFSLYRWVIKFPGLGSMRALQRIINIELIFFAIAFAFCYRYFFAKYRFQVPLFLIAISLFIADNYFEGAHSFRTEKQMAKNRVDQLEEKLKALPPRAIFSHEPDSLTASSVAHHIDAMLAAQQLAMRTTNGYSGTSPAGYTPYWNNIDAASRTEWLNRVGYPMDSVHIVP